MEPRYAPEWQTATWLNTPEPLSLQRLRGRVVLLHAFQMICPGCVARGLPQAQRVADLFANAPLTVIGLHTVFEHHEAMGLESLRAFLHEYRIRFPVGVDLPGADGDPIPRTMRAYAMQGTPTTVLIDASSRLRRQAFGVHDDLLLGADLGALFLEAAPSVVDAESTSAPRRVMDARTVAARSSRWATFPLRLWSAQSDVLAARSAGLRVERPPAPVRRGWLGLRADASTCFCRRCRDRFRPSSFSLSRDERYRPVVRSHRERLLPCDQQLNGAATVRAY